MEMKEMKKPKKKRTFLVPEDTLAKLQADANIKGKSLNEMLEECINVYRPDVIIKREFRACPIKYGESGRIKK